MLSRLTFTGLDAYTDPNALLSIADRYPQVEFAVLLGSDTKKKEGKKNPRYPSMDVVKYWKHWARDCNVPFAIHLCGRYARMLDHPEKRKKLANIVRGADRVQVNAFRWTIEAMLDFMNSITARHVILQTQDSYRTTVQHYKKQFDEHMIADFPQKLEFIFDRSAGTGVEDWEHWPVPPSDHRFGYCGGLSPTTACADFVVDFLKENKDRELWLDMESGIRTDKTIYLRSGPADINVFDIAKVRLMCRLLTCEGGLGEQLPLKERAA